MQWPRSFSERVAAVSTLDDPVRRELLDLVTRSEAPVSRDEAAQALGLSRRATAFHLDRLAEKGVLAVEFRRLTRRSGPGAGRPSKLYRPPPGQGAGSLPHRPPPPGPGGGRGPPPPPATTTLPASFWRQRWTRVRAPGSRPARRCSGSQGTSAGSSGSKRGASTR